MLHHIQDAVLRMTVRTMVQHLRRDRFQEVSRLHIKNDEKQSLLMLFVELLLDFDLGAFPF